MVQRLHEEVPGEPINRDLMSYLRTASMETGRLSEDEKVHVLLDAAEGIRMLLSKRPTSLGELRRTSWSGSQKGPKPRSANHNGS
jgi:hypothetical protein